MLYSNKGIPASKPLFPAVVWQRVGIGRSTRLRQAQKGSKKLNSMLGRIRKPGKEKEIENSSPSKKTDALTRNEQENGCANAQRAELLERQLEGLRASALSPLLVQESYK